MLLPAYPIWHCAGLRCSAVDEESCRWCCFYQLWQLRSVLRCVATDTLHTLVHTFITSGIDYCIAVLYGVADSHSATTAVLLHAAAWRLMDQPHSTNIVGMDTLQWLPMSPSITFKSSVTLMTYNCIRRRSPVYFPFAPSFTLLTTMTWLCHILGLCIMVHTLAPSFHVVAL